MKTVHHIRLLITSILLTFMLAANAAPFDQIGGSIQLFGIKDINPNSNGKAPAYSPYVMHLPPWASYVMYHCLGYDASPTWQDQVWRTESYSGGDSNFINHIQSIVGAPGSSNEESCSPGVAIDPSNTWQMYYVASPANNSTGSLGVFHATAPNPGLSWVNANGGAPISLPYPSGSYFETPSPIYISNSLYMSLVVGSTGNPNNQSVRILSAVNGNYFIEIGNPVVMRNGVNDNTNVSHGRIAYLNGVFYMVYSKTRSGGVNPDTIALATSTDAVNWSYQKDLVVSTSSTGWDSRYVWAPQVILNNNQLWLYYAGNDFTWASSTDFFGYGGTIGLRKFTLQ